MSLQGRSAFLFLRRSAMMAARSSSLAPNAQKQAFSYSTVSSSPLHMNKAFQETPLGRNGTHLLAGLDVYSVPASGDNHPLAVYGIQSEVPLQQDVEKPLYPILLLHGRTWSSVPVYHLHLDAKRDRQASEESRSFMEALLAKGTNKTNSLVQKIH